MNAFIQKISYTQILLMALFFRLGASIFSYGYGFHDDHFITVEIARSWVDNYNESQWLPDAAQGVTSASGHSRFYPNILRYTMIGLESVGIINPEWVMFIIRLMHALFSLLIVHYGYKISKKLFDENSSKAIALLLAVFWFMPMLSVRNLVEMVCIPPLMIGAYMLLNRDKTSFYYLLLAGFIAGMAVSVRFQCLIMVGGMGLALFIEQRWRDAIWYGIGALLSIIVLQGIPDYFMWGLPFAEFIGYYDYNIKNSGAYPSGEWYNFILLISGLMLIPLGIAVWFGYFKNIKKNIIIWLPALLFLAFHSYFPNKQERFILPCVPFIIICGIGGWMQIENSSAFWSKNRKLLNGLYIFFILFNTILLFALSFSSSKANRVDAMNYLRKKGDVKAYIVETSHVTSTIPLPRFYLGKWCDRYTVTQNESAEKLKAELSEHPERTKPNYVVFMDEVQIGSRIVNFSRKYGKVHFETMIEPSPLDRFMTWINPVNENQTTYVFRIE